MTGHLPRPMDAAAAKGIARAFLPERALEITSGVLIVDGLKVNDPKVDERLIRQEAKRLGLAPATMASEEPQAVQA